MLRGLLVWLSVFLFFFSSAQPSQTFNGTGGGIPDNNTWVSFPVTVSNLNQAGINGTWGFEKLVLSINHTYDGDLQVHLVSPGGVEVIVFNNVGGGGHNFSNTNFKMTYTTSIISGSAPFSGNYKPMGDFGAFNDGSNGNGIWHLKIRDTYPVDSGTVLSWSIRFSNTPASPPAPFSSNLPLILVNTYGQGIPDEPKILADFRVIDNGPGVRNYSNDTVFQYQGPIGIEVRGSSSSSAPKLSYGFETWDANNQQIDTGICGFPAQSDWILSASYYDKSLMRNVLSYKLFNEMTHYASRTKYVELVLNGQYQGVYMVMEKIKRDKNRVNIAKLKDVDTSGNELTGGYIFKIDKFTGSGGAGFYSNYPPSNPTGDAIYYQYEYPSDVNIQPQQQAYIRSYVDSFEAALFGPNFRDPVNGFRRFAGERTFMDFMLVNEISKNVDGYRLSTFFHKDKLGKIKAGPVWDYDITYMNANYCQAWIDTGWAYNLNYVCSGAAVPAHWERMMQDTLFQQHLRCRWAYLRQDVLNEDSLLAWVDSTASYLDESQQRNFTTWPELGVATWPEPSPIPQTYAEELQRLKTWIHNRLIWLDAKIYAYPVLKLTPDLGSDTLLCGPAGIQLNAGDFDSYQWSNGAAQQSVFVAQSGTYIVTVNDEFSCAGVDSFKLTVIPPLAPNVGADTTICNGLALTLNAGIYNAYNWSNGSNSATITAAQSGPYAVTVSDVNGCSGTDNINVVISTSPVVNLGADTTVCAGETVNLSSLSNGATYTWSTGASSPVLAVTAAGYYMLTVTNTDGCSSSDSIAVSVRPLPNASFNTTQTGLNNFSFNAVDDTATSYMWDLGDGSSDTQQSVSHSYTANGNYTVSLTITDGYGCNKVQTAQVTVNGLSVNDVPAETLRLYPNPAKGYVTINSTYSAIQSIVIYDLTGQKVIGSSANGKTVTVDVSQLAAGTYFVSAKIEGINYQTRFVKQ